MAALPTLKPALRLVTSAVLLLAILAVPAGSGSTTKLANAAVSTDPGEAERACDALRALGPTGLDALLAAHRAAVERGPDMRLRAALDRVAGQYDAHSARLYWYTDLEPARAEAARLGRPILSLRLLGRLDEDLSCANSRLFRAVLYADPAVNRVLRERYVLHWSSERPAPKITIDYGDGRTLVRTITGNSAHFVLDASGRVADVIPGMWGPAGFREALEDAATLAARLAPPDAAGANLRVRSSPGWSPDVEAEAAMLRWDRERPAGVPTAREAAARTYSKSAMQMPAIAALEGNRPNVEPNRNPDPNVEAIVARERAGVVLSAESRALFRAKEGPGSGAPDAGVAGNAEAEARFAHKLARLEDMIARDQTFNRIALRSMAREWLLAEPRLAVNPAELQRRLYAEAFLTPRDDPWMGLLDADALTGQDRGGLRPR